MDRRFSPLVMHGKFTPRPKEIARARATAIFNAWLRGMSYEQAAATAATKSPASVDEVRQIIRRHVEVLRKAQYKWKLAEVKCHALAMELRLLRLGADAPDQPIETLNPPEFWLRSFKGFGIETVNQLRAVDAEMLLAHWRFPRGAIDWAVMKLDKLGLSHALKRPERVRLRQRNSIGKRIIR